jgi:SAM-dependent methyltransferase
MRDRSRFVEERPKDIRVATPWHRYAHHIRVLPKRLRLLSEDLHLPPGGRVLDYGSAEAPYRDFFPPHADFVAADLPGNPSASLELNPDGTLPVPDESFDVVLSTQVLEHVADPELYLSECFRVLRPGGRMLLSTHGIFVYHPDPEDYWRWTGAGLQYAVRRAGFEVVRFEGIIGLVATGLQLIEDAVYHHLPRAVRPLLAFVMQSLMRLADRLQGGESRDLNAQVFALVAGKPPETAAGGP